MNWKPIAVFVLGALVGFLLMGNGPIGNMIWPPAPGPDPEGANLVLLMIVGFIEVIAFGLGACVLAFGRPAAEKITGTTGLYATGVWLSITWLLMNWVPHTALHMNHGNILVPADFTGLVAIEYGFHFTLVLAGAMLMHALFRVGGGKPTMTKTSATTPRAT